MKVYDVVDIKGNSKLLNKILKEERISERKIFGRLKGV